MAKFKKKPVIIEAIQFKGVSGGLVVVDGDSFPSWAEVAILNGVVYSALVTDGIHVLHIRTLEGVMTANPGDWLIRGVESELYACKDSVFQKTYEPVLDLSYVVTHIDRDGNTMGAVNYYAPPKEDPVTLKGYGGLPDLSGTLKTDPFDVAMNPDSIETPVLTGREQPPRGEYTPFTVTGDEQAVLDAMARNVARVERIEKLEAALREAAELLEELGPIALEAGREGDHREYNTTQLEVDELCTKIQALLGEEG